MDPQARAEYLRRSDLFKRDYEHANTQLAIWAMTLRNNETPVEHLRSFTDAGLHLSEVCNHELSEHSPLDVLFWVEKALRTEMNKGHRDCRYRAICTQKMYQVKDLITSLCRNSGRGNVVPLFAA